MLNPFLVAEDLHIFDSRVFLFRLCITSTVVSVVQCSFKIIVMHDVILDVIINVFFLFQSIYYKSYKLYISKI